VRNVLVLGRERHLVDVSTAIIEQNGFRAVGVTADEEALALLDTGDFIAVLIGNGVEPGSRPLLRAHASPHGTAVFEARRVLGQTVHEHVRQVVVPHLLRLVG
jgi:hypothetical protein